jgi:hypothetical protein
VSNIGTSICVGSIDFGWGGGEAILSGFGE